jgi:ferredoxin
MEISLAVVDLPPPEGADGAAREAALGVLASARLEGAGFVEYRSAGIALVVGPGARALAAARALDEQLTCAVVDVDASAQGADAERLVVARGRVSGLTGYLGAFRAVVDHDGREHELAGLVRPGLKAVDLVLDLGAEPLIGSERPPPGYCRVGDDADALAAALAQMPELVGEFQKPRYFAYRETLCAHGSRGISGCHRCLDACAADAIASRGERIEVDPYLCQGCGSCATTCPSGAMGYAFPATADLLGTLRRAVEAWREHGDSAPALLFHDDKAGAEQVAALLGELPQRVLPVAVEDVGSIGPDTWFALLAFGASDVLLMLPEDAEARLLATTWSQLGLAAEILTGIGESAERIHLVRDPDALRQAASSLHPRAPRSLQRRFSVSGGKRAVWQQALGALADPPPAAFPLSAGAPFGTVEVDRDACTLCMACAAVCPLEALSSAGDLPQLRFAEDRCVQCGLCEQACPEDAIRLQPRLDVRAQTGAAGERVLNEEAPFHCIDCGKAFATERIIRRISGQLAGHAMFADDRARRRLEMCEDCRVRDLLFDEGGIERVR